MSTLNFSLQFVYFMRFFFSKSDLADSDNPDFFISGDLTFATPTESTALGAASLVKPSILQLLLILNFFSNWFREESVVVLSTPCSLVVLECLVLLELSRCTWVALLGAFQVHRCRHPFLSELSKLL